jgi:hypothetical protein
VAQPKYPHRSTAFLFPARHSLTMTIRKLVVGRFTFVADLSARCYRFKAIGTISNLLNGLVDVAGCPIEMASPTGLAPTNANPYRLAGVAIRSAA